ncbi:hypothetical protein RB195_022237 [Necator americanus]|uniref:Endonuclease/exonuclease/phosphatase domain-containing protein n=1 Tax=Necator americanus TaxID=51031 RepID=A0ABR1EEG2_NECAM
MAICTYNARTLASEAAIEDLMMQAKKIKYDVIGLNETRRRHPLNAVYETGEELFLGTCDSRGVGGVGVLVNTRTAKNSDFFGQLTTRIERLRIRRCGPTPALTIFVSYAPTSSYEEENVEAFYMDLEKTINNWDLFATPFGLGSGFWEDSTVDSIDGQYDRLVEHLHDSQREAHSSKTTKRCPFPETLGLIRERGAARAAGNQQLTSEFAWLCRDAIKQDLKERKAEVLADAAEAEKAFDTLVENSPIERRG